MVPRIEKGCFNNKPNTIYITLGGFFPPKYVKYSKRVVFLNRPHHLDEYDYAALNLMKGNYNYTMPHFRGHKKAAEMANLFYERTMNPELCGVVGMLNKPEGMELQLIDILVPYLKCYNHLLNRGEIYS